MRAHRARIVAVIATAVMAVGVAPAGAQDGPVLSWDSDTALMLAPQIGASTITQVRNDTARRTQVDFKTTGALRVRPSWVMLGPAAAATITVTSTASTASQGAIAAVVDPGRLAENGFVLWRNVEVGPVTPVPAVASVQVRSTWGAPWASTAGAVVPLATPDACSKLEVPATPVGYVQADDGGSAAIKETCITSGKGIALQLSFDKLARTGAKYQGQATIGATTVSITVERSTTLWIPLVLLVLGLLLALWLLERSPQRVVAQLRRRLLLARAQVGSRAQPGSAVVAFRQAADGAEWGKLDIFDDTDIVAQRIEEEIGALRRAKRFSLTADHPQAKVLSNQISSIETAIADLAPLAEHLRQLQQRLGPVEASLMLPAWTDSVRDTLLAARVLAVSDVAEHAANVAAAAATSVWWPSVLQQTTALQQRLSELHQHQTDWTAQQNLQITTAQGLFDVALAAFARATSVDDVHSVYGHEFHRAQAAVDALASLKVTPRFGVAAPVLVPLASLTVPPPEAYISEARAIVSAQRRASTISVVILGLLFLLAGLQALYVGKTFGTLWDLAAALAWGAAAGTVVTPLAAAIEGFASARTGDGRG